MKRIAVYCGSNSGNQEIFAKDAADLGAYLAENEIELVYGGSKVGLMGIVADAVLKNGGSVIGVMPVLLKNREIAHEQLTELIVVENMHQRKEKMMELADGFIALPGGPGTLEELFEAFTWGQIGLHQKPCGIFNSNGFYAHLSQHFDTMVHTGFMTKQSRKGMIIGTTPAEIIQYFENYQAPTIKTYS
ncbi:LOG family protein [Carnobacterium gallinarum]|uniref:LOG family protein n=1 Tax=Carnobacterium gallinarum TaxID=2749 RepID=UPI0005596238|nr:TIGR00730 family Rossman fold protein [Carnobacterium gallinarum]